MDRYGTLSPREAHDLIKNVPGLAGVSLSQVVYHAALLEGVHLLARVGRGDVKRGYPLRPTPVGRKVMAAIGISAGRGN
jgi:hypothetical protein